MNLATLRDQVAKFIGDPDLTRHTPADYLTALNRAQEQFALDTRSLWKDTTWTSVANDATYSLPSDFMFEESVYFDGLLLTPTSRRDFAILSPKTDWTLTTGTPTRFLIDPEEATKQILLYPIPTANDAGKTIAMRYCPLPTALSADTDIPLNSSALLAQFHLGIASFAAALLLDAESATPELMAKKRELMSRYADMSAKAVDLFRNTSSAPWRMRGSRPT